MITFADDVNEKDLKKAIVNADASMRMAWELLRLINGARDLTHNERIAMTKSVMFVLANARNELDADAHGGIPF